MRPSTRATAILALCALGGCNQHSEAEEAVRSLMKDPDATEFRSVSTCPDDRTVTHGDYNAKNSFGAYVGFEPFFYAADVGAVLLEDHEFSAMIPRCYGNAAVAEALPTADGVEAIEGAMREIGEPVPSASETSDLPPEPRASASECFGDYCPCDASDPDYGGADVPLCRSLEQGVSVDDEMMAAAAGLRDARRQLREFEEQEGGF